MDQTRGKSVLDSVLGAIENILISNDHTTDGGLQVTDGQAMHMARRLARERRPPSCFRTRD